MTNTDTKKDELREKLEDISCEYGRPHEDSCDLNQEEGAVDGCTCSVGKLLDEIAEFVNQCITTLAERKVKEAEAKHDEIYKWLLGESDDFPASEPGKRYGWRTELRKRLSTLKEKNT